MEHSDYENEDEDNQDNICTHALIACRAELKDMRLHRRLLHKVKQQCAPSKRPQRLHASSQRPQQPPAQSIDYMDPPADRTPLGDPGDADADAEMGEGL